MSFFSLNILKLTKLKQESNKKEMISLHGFGGSQRQKKKQRKSLPSPTRDPGNEFRALEITLVLFRSPKAF